MRAVAGVAVILDMYAKRLQLWGVDILESAAEGIPIIILIPEIRLIAIILKIPGFVIAAGFMHPCDDLLLEMAYVAKSKIG